MQTREWTFRHHERAVWGPGLWDNEPDKRQWTDQVTNLPCLLFRGPIGALCGYVGVSKDHPAYGVDYIDIPDELVVHGGLTFSGFCDPDPDCKEHGICHITDPGEDNDVWWLGFDCAHMHDIVPAYTGLLEPVWGLGESYKTISYVTAQCRHLAAQLAAMMSR